MTADIDIETLNGIRQMMGARFPELIEKYLKNTQVYIAQAREAAKMRNGKGVADAVHPMKSSSASLGLAKMASLAQNIEGMAEDENPDWVAVSGGVDAIGEAFRSTADTLRRAAGEA